MVKAEYVRNPHVYLTQGNVHILGLADKKADKKFMGLASNRTRLFALDNQTGTITYYKLDNDLLERLNKKCCDPNVINSVVHGDNKDKITFKGAIERHPENKITLEENHIKIHTKTRIYDLKFKFRDESEYDSSTAMKNNINRTGKYKVEETNNIQGGSKRKTRKHGRKHKKRTHKKRSSKRRTRRQKRRAGRKLAKKSRKSRRRR